jgi:molybdopterin converting factor small subunit
MYEVTVQFYGVLAEIAGTSQTTLKDIDNIEKLKHMVSNTYPKMNSHNYIVAVDNKIAGNNSLICNGSKIALMPPYSGG